MTRATYRSSLLWIAALCVAGMAIVVCTSCATVIVEPPCQPKTEEKTEETLPIWRPKLFSLPADGTTYDGCNTTTCKDGVCITTLLWCGSTVTIRPTDNGLSLGNRDPRFTHVRHDELMWTLGKKLNGVKP